MMEREKLISLVTAAQAGDHSAINDLFNGFYNDVYFYALKTCADEDIACEVTQETFVEIIHTLNSLKEPAAFVVWMKQITYHQCTRHFKKLKSRGKYESTAEPDESGFSVLDFAAEDRQDFIPDEAMDHKEFRQTILDMLNQLSPELRSALILYYYDELSVKQIAQIQSISESAAKSRLFHGRKYLKDAIEHYEKKHNIKLHSFGLFPLFLWLFQSREILSGVALVGVSTGISAVAGKGIAISSTSAAAGVTATAGTAGTAAGAGAAAVGSAVAATGAGVTAGGMTALLTAIPLSTKIVAAAVLTLTVCGAAATIPALIPPEATVPGADSPALITTAPYDVQLRDTLPVEILPGDTLPGDSEPEEFSPTEPTEFTTSPTTVTEPEESAAPVTSATSPTEPSAGPVTEPTQPAEPTTPDTEPATHPTEPVTEPTPPVETTEPATEPTVPPEQPSSPHEPDEPQAPEKPDDPHAPEPPRDPDEPDAPDEPDEPDQPDPPYRPIEPNGPIEPEEPEKPEVPEDPTEPEESIPDDTAPDMNSFVVPNGYQYYRVSNASAIGPGGVVEGIQDLDMLVGSDFEYIYLSYYDGWWVQSHAKNLSEYKLLASINGKPLVGMHDTFKNWTSLTKAPVIPSTVREIYGAFSGCTALTEPPVLPSGVTVLNSAFFNCTSLQTAPVIPAHVRDMEKAFMNCTSLSGTIVINGTPVYYKNCFSGTTKAITITGNCSILEKLAATSSNGNVTAG